MNLLSLYSKIQLKIEKVKGELKLLSCLDRGLSHRKTAVKTAWKFQLLFWQTLKIIVRFFALLFNDSSENYLIFTRLNKDSVFVCNNSYCQYKRFQKKVRFYSKTAFAGILICTIIATSVLYLFMPGKPSSFAATYNWLQSEWNGGASMVAPFPDHTDGVAEAGWTKYYEKDANVITGEDGDGGTVGQIKLSSTSDSWTETTNADFDGTPTDVQASGDDLILLPPTTTTTTFSASDTDADEGGASNINFDTGSGVVKLDVTTQTLILRPNGVGDYTNIASQTPASSAHWDKVDEAVADDSDYVYNNGTTQADVYALENHTTEAGEIQQVKIYFRHYGGVASATPRLRLGTNEVYGTLKEDVDSWTTFSEVLSRPGGGGWSWADIDNLQAGAQISGDEAPYLSQLYIEVTYSTYNSPGAFTSTNLLSAQTVGPIDSFNYKLDLPAGAGAKVCFTQDDPSGTPTWRNSSNVEVLAGDSTDWNALSDSGAGENEIPLSALNYTGANFYYKMEFTSDGSDTPTLDEVSVHTNYPSTGNLISSIKDTGEADPDFSTITWSETLNGGDIDFKVRSSDNADMSGATAWGSIAIIESSGVDISGIGNGRYVQYQAILESSADQTQTPHLHDVTINWGITSTLTSSPYDASDAGNVFNKITWDEGTPPANTDIKFQLRTAPDSSGSPGTWTSWCGPDNGVGVAGCDTTTYFTDPTGGETVDADFTDGAGDQWIQYKVFLSSTGASTPTLSSVTLQYVINAPPAVVVTSASQDSSGIVNISYTIADEDSSSAIVSFLADVGIALGQNLIINDSSNIVVTNIDRLPAASVGTPQTIQIESEQITYTGKSGSEITGITRGANTTKDVAHSSGAVIWIKGTTANVSGDVGSVTELTSSPASKTGTWTIKNDLDGVYYATAKIRVNANDGNAANQVGYDDVDDIDVFSLDMKDPAYSSPPLIIDSNVAGDTLTNITVTEDSTLSVRYVDASNIDGSTCADDIASVEYESLVGSSKDWTLAPDANGVSTVCFQAKDNRGNVTAVTFASTPQTVTDAQVNDISFPPSSKFKLLIWWGVVPDPGSFTQYNIYRSTNGTDYLPYTTISDREINYCFDEGDDNCTDDNLGGLVNTTTYYYKITAQDTDGISTYSSVVSAVPDGSTSGEVDATAPTLSSGPSDSVSSSTATITWTTNEASYSLVRYGASTSLGSVAGSPTETVTSHSVDLSGLTPGVLYYYQILSADSSGNLLSSPADPLTGLHTFTTTADNTAPTISSCPTVTAGRDSATISWVTDEASDSQVKYIVAADNTTDPAGIGGTTTTLQTEKVTNHYVIITGLSSDTTYNYQVISTDAYTNTLTSPSSAPFVQFITSTDKEDSTAPGITFNSVDDVTEGLTTATIVWTTDENAYSVVEYGLTESLGSVAGTVDNSTMSHSVTISNLSNNTKYYYKLRSADSSGNLATEPSSGTHWFTTTADTIDPVISSVTVASSDRSSAVITWNTDENASSQVEYGFNANLSGSSSTTLQTEKVLNHITVLANLTPDRSHITTE